MRLPYVSVAIFSLLSFCPGRAAPAPITGTAVQARQNPNPVNLLLALITQLFPLNVLVQDLGSLVEDAETVFADLAGFDTSQDDLTAGRCGDVVIVFARGTSEPGNVGSLVGPPFFNEMRERLSTQGKSLAVQGVDDYVADVEGFLQGGDTKGSQRMADLITQAQTQCPSSKVIMSGYSQGGQLVHNAAKLLPQSTMSDLSSIVIFGDPFNGFPIQGADANKVLTICHVADNICDHGDWIHMPHLTYLIDAGTATDFALERM
ncbi:hypothetical protein PFICI_04742 [Pestalotiopsis fici W106-1]|uniref:Cutinase n=1 Tax=Pestalotiopsis fici (strain W106-1 / CGMCC3.15140) TaxID=1229662 RepID=W3XCG2_PESFW|nr:uncharacterized protein PFICI_04742 [Pestalotiopsis fici W106-1]ETS82866.1 hypothetical protein PFICI_04742 [Pestalotiopsis fici W106-1]